jgi:large subunit ribosomal protein L9
MKVFLRKDIEKLGMAGEVVKVEDGFARNYLIPRKLAVEVTKNNVTFYQEHAKSVDHRKEVIASQTSMLAERISNLKLTIKRKMHDDGKLYGAISPAEIVELLAGQGVSISKGQVKIDKSIKTKGTYEVVIKLTSRLQPKVKLVVVSE